MITIREETFHDVEPREALLDACFGPARFQKTCERLREGRLPAGGLSLVIDRDGEVIGTVRLWHVSAGPTCDSADVLYEKDPYMLPFSLEIGDKVLIEGTGAYTTTYSAVAFNGFPPLKTHVI